jgi:Flp pilus assembly secretin CpaC
MKNKYLKTLPIALLLLSPLPSFAEGEKIKEQPWMSESYDDFDEKLTQHAELHITRNGRTYLIDLLYSRSDDVLTTLKEIFESDLSSGNITLSHNSATNSILARFAEDPDQSLIDELCDVIYSVDRKTGQVLIDVLVVELNLNDRDIFDIEYKELFSNVAGTTNSLVNVAVDHGNINSNDPSSTTIGFKALITSGAKMKAFVNAYQQKGKAAVVSSPHIVTANHREAIFKTGEKVPLIESTRPSTNGPINSYKVEDVGLQLKVTPHINRSGDIDLEVFQTIDSITDYDEKNYTARISNREATTNLTLKNGETMVLGGFIEEHNNVNENRVPILSNLPLIGKAFRSTSKSKTKTELMVFITPKIIRTPEEGKASTRKMIARTSNPHKNMVNKYLELRKMELSPLDSNQEIILDRRSKGWEYTLDKKIVDEIVWRIPDNLDVSDLEFEKKGDAPFGFGNSRSIFPAPVRTYLKPSDGVIFKRSIFLAENSDYKSFIIKVASDNAASVYINKKLVDFDTMMKMAEGHEFTYWNREVEIPADCINKGENELVVLLGNDKDSADAYFDIMIIGNK